MVMNIMNIKLSTPLHLIGNHPNMQQSIMTTSSTVHTHVLFHRNTSYVSYGM